MKKLLLGLLLLTALLSVLPGVSAQSTTSEVADLTALASYFPDTAYAYVGFRTDTDSLRQLDTIVTRLANALPGATSTSLSDSLDSAVTQMTGRGTFQADIRPWLGDSAALAVLNPPPVNSPNYSSSPAVAVAVSITDREGAQQFAKDALSHEFPGEEIEAGFHDDYTIFIPSGQYTNTYALVTADTLFITSNKSLLPREGHRPASPLSAKEQFQTALGSLPEENYSAIVYMDLPEIIQQAYTGYASGEYPSNGLTDQAIQQVFNAYGPMALGLTVLDERSLTADVAVRFDYQSIVSAMGLQMPPIHGFDTSFPIFQYVPANARLVAHGNGLGPMVQSQMHNLRAMSDLMQQEMTTMQQSLGSDNPFSDVSPRDIANFATLAFSGLTGLSLQNDVLNWMTGDYVMFASESSGPQRTNTPGFPADFGLVVQVTDPAAARKVYDGVQSALDQFEAHYSTETVGGAALIVVPLDDSIATPVSLPDEMAIGFNDHVLAVGTRRAVEGVFDDSDKLEGDALFTAEQSRMLDNAYVSFYANIAQLTPLVQQLEQWGNTMSNGVGPIENTAVRALSVFDSAAVSASLQNGNQVTMRFVLTLSGE